MGKQFATYEIALKLKELGFEEGYCFAFYNEKGILQPDTLWSINKCLTSGNYAFKGFTEDSEYTRLLVQYCSAPLWQQAIDWFREKFEVYIELNGTFSSESNKECYLTDYSCLVTYKSPDKSRWEIDYLGEDTLNYYEAREQAILKAIELIKNKK